MTGGDGSEPMTAEDDNPRQITGGPWRQQPKAEDDNPRQITGGPWRSPFCFGRETGWKKEREREREERDWQRNDKKIK
jgi:hypothetical protein